MNLKGAVFILSCSLGLSSCIAINRPLKEIPLTEFTGKFIDTPVVKEAFASMPASTSGTHALFFDGGNRPIGQTDDFNQVYAASLQSYLEEIANKLLATYPGVKPKIQVLISDSKAFSPYSTPYNELIIPIGMLTNATTDDEIAGLLAHELSHILLNHFARVEDQIKQRRLSDSLGTLATTAIQLTTSRVQLTPGKGLAINQTSSATAQNLLSQAAIAKTLLNGITDTLWYPTWQRAQEQQADYLAADLMVASGYSVKGFRNALKRLEDYQGKQKELGDVLAKQQQSLSNDLQNFAKIEANNMLVNPNLNNLASDATKVGLNMALQTVVNIGLYEKQQQETTHPEIKERLANDRNYWSREYQNESSRPASKQKLTEALAKPDSMATIKANELAFNALQLVNNGDLKQAEKLSQLAVKTDPTSPKPHYALAMLRKAQHKNDQAIKELEAIPRWDGASLSAHHEITSSLMMSGQSKQALAYINKAEQRGWKEDFAYQKVTALYQQNDKAMAKQAYTECKEYRQVKKQCEASFARRL